MIDEETREPLAVYHGTNADFDVFQSGNSAGLLYFAFDEKAAKKAARNKNTIMSVFLSMKNPANSTETPKHWYDAENSHEVALWKKQGHDGIYVKDEAGMSIAVFSPNQMKSATGNAGTFSEGTNHILYQLVGEKGAAALDTADAENAAVLYALKEGGANADNGGMNITDRDGLKNFIDDSMTNRPAINKRVRIGDISENAQKHITDKFEVSLKQIDIDSSGVIHAMKKEAHNLEQDDLLLAVDVINNSDSIELANRRHKGCSVLEFKKDVNGEITFLAERHDREGYLLVFDAWRKKKARRGPTADTNNAGMPRANVRNESPRADGPLSDIPPEKSSEIQQNSPTPPDDDDPLFMLAEKQADDEADAALEKYDGPEAWMEAENKEMSHDGLPLEGWDMDIDELEWYTGRWNAAVQRREARLEAEGGLTVTTTYADNKFLDKMEGKWSEAAAREMGTGIIGEVPRCSLVQDAEAEGKTVLEKFPSSEMSGIYRSLAGLLAGRRAAA